MSGLSLREQLLQAGLVTEKQAKQAESQQKRQVYQGNKNLSKRDRAARRGAGRGAAESGGREGGARCGA